MSMPDAPARSHSPSSAIVEPAASTALIWAAFVVALIALAGSLFLSLGMHKKACPLCYYQRLFVMGVVGVLAMGLLTAAYRLTSLGVLVLPLAAAALGVAAFHVTQEARGKMECPAGVLGLGSAPQQSLTILVILFLILGGDALRARAGLGVVACAIVVGLVLAFGAVQSTAPTPKPAPEEYLKPPDICRPLPSPA